MAPEVQHFLLIVCLTLKHFAFCMTDQIRDNATLRSSFVGLSFESESEKSLHQKHYVELLNAKLLAHGRDVIERNDLSNGYDRATDQDKGSLQKESNPSQFISSYLRKISNVKLGVTAMQEIYDSLPSVNFHEEATDIVKEISRRISKKVNSYLKVLGQNKHFLEENFLKGSYSFDVGQSPCCHVPTEMFRYDEHFGADVTRTLGCESYLYNNISKQDYFESFLTPTLKLNLDALPTLLWQYFISLDGIHFEYPAHNGHLAGKCNPISDRHREVFQSSVMSPKLVIIVIEQGYSLSSFQFHTAKVVAKHILSLLTDNDRVAVLGLASDVQYAIANNCSLHKTLRATYDAKIQLSRFIDNLDRKQNITNHVLGFQKTFEIISKYESSNVSVSGDILIAYISRGLLSSLIDAKQVLETIADGHRSSKNTIVINTYAIVDGEKVVMLEKDFLKCVAEQNFKNYNIHFRSKQKIKKGVMVPINSTSNLVEKVGNIFAAFQTVHHPEPLFSLPYWESLSKGMVISLTQQVFQNQKLTGIVGVDISLNDLAEDCVSYYSYKNSNYLFIIDQNGTVLVHPSLSNPPFTNEHHSHSLIWHLEDKPGFKDIYSAIIREPYGEEFLPFAESDEYENQKSELDMISYTWRKVEGTPYIVVLLSSQPRAQKKMLKDTVVPEVVKFIYHRLDLLPSSGICRHMKQLSSLGSTALFLSASCFTMPYKYLVEEETKQMVQNYMAYLTDTTKLIANPGLKAGIRSEVLAVSWITPTWERACKDDQLSNYVVRRFIATTSGVFQVYPATLIEKMYDATRRDWYIRALDHPGKIILTAPYLDVGGAGYVITLSHTIFEGKPNALHNSFDKVAAVMGIDFTFGYFYKLLLDKVPICKTEKIVCFLLDDRGYLIAHPDLIEPSGRGPVEQQHITHKEPLVANDLLNHKEFVTKKVCNSFSDRTIQRYYELNTSLHGVLTNQIHGEHSTKYQVMAIKGTNIFLGIVNRTSDGITAFCPCSMTDRLCLNCHRMEPTECECPCECPFEMDLCSGELLDDNNKYPTCKQFPEEPNLPLVDHVLLESLQPCFEYHCTTRSELSDCFGILGCEWCQLESDGTTPLLNKFCTDQRKCFGGVLGARTPYADEIIEGLPTEQFLIFKSPVGPVAGGFMVFFIMVALAVYCYRNHVRRGLASHHSISVPDTNLRMAHFNNEPDEPDIFQEPVHPVAPGCQLLPPIDNIVVSPYRVPSNYRRPPGGDSDHGYSTMTPHEDSEHTPYFEPLLIGKDKYFVPASQQSLSSCSRASSPMTHYPQGLPPMTYIPSASSHAKGDALVPPWIAKNNAIPPGSYILAQVEVHSENVH